ncbi:hypothetical protein [Sinorhizobium americanum]|uniref:hypothetical protein n=1 Tax=Sinorhizobium americanum TaxID=194963 RepID=UPI0012EB2740|nr:hypothetical protein [Sinorhizobium americanum]
MKSTQLMASLKSTVPSAKEKMGASYAPALPAATDRPRQFGGHDMEKKCRAMRGHLAFATAAVVSLTTICSGKSWAAEMVNTGYFGN